MMVTDLLSFIQQWLKTRKQLESLDYLMSIPSASTPGIQIKDSTISHRISIAKSLLIKME